MKLLLLYYLILNVTLISILCIIINSTRVNKEERDFVNFQFVSWNTFDWLRQSWISSVLLDNWYILLSIWEGRNRNWFIDDLTWTIRQRPSIPPVSQGRLKTHCPSDYQTYTIPSFTITKRPRMPWRPCHRYPTSKVKTWTRIYAVS
jgi:hypothetical protein